MFFPPFNSETGQLFCAIIFPQDPPTVSPPPLLGKMDSDPPPLTPSDPNYGRLWATTGDYGPKRVRYYRDLVCPHSTFTDSYSFFNAHTCYHAPPVLAHSLDSPSSLGAETRSRTKNGSLIQTVSPNFALMHRWCFFHHPNWPSCQPPDDGLWPRQFILNNFPPRGGGFTGCGGL